MFYLCMFMYCLSCRPCLLSCLAMNFVCMTYCNFRRNKTSFMAILKISDRDFLLEFSFSMETPDVFRGFSRLDMSFRSGFMSI